RVDGRAVDGDAVLGRLDDGVGLGVHRRHAVAVLHHVAHLVAVGQATDAAVVAGGEDRAIPYQHRPHVFAITGRAGGDLQGDVHEVAIPGAALGHGLHVWSPRGPPVNRRRGRSAWFRPPVAPLRRGSAGRARGTAGRCGPWSPG